MTPRKTRITVGYAGHLEELEVLVPPGEPDPWDARSQLEVVSQRVPRLDAIAKVTGRAKYTYDIRLPGMLHARVLRSPHPSARLLGVDLAPAKLLPGVKATWSERAGRKVLYQGQEIAAVAATSPDVAEDALRLVVAKYDVRPFVVDATLAQAPGAPLVFDSPSKMPDPDEDDLPGSKTRHAGNLRTTVGSQPPGVDIEQAFREADVVVEGTYRTQVQTHSALETHGAVARWSGNELTRVVLTQATFAVRDQLAGALKLPKDRVRVLCEHMGGGFGAKFNAGPWSIIAAQLARDAGNPVKLMLSRRDEHLVGGNRPDSVQWLKLGAKRDGTLVALHLKSYGTPGVGTGAGTGGPARAIYKLKTWKTEESDVFTHAGGAQPFRAPGHPQGCFALEQAIDELAAKLGMDPVELRRKNLVNPVQVAELDRAVEHCAAWKSRGVAGSSAGPVKRGVGLACGVWYKIVNPSTQAQIDVHNDGRVEVMNGAQDIGTGTRTWMAQVAAEELGLPLAGITVRLGDTTWPIGPGSGGSTTSQSLAPTVRAAAYQAKQKLLAVAARFLKARPEELTVRGGAFFVTAQPTRAATWKQVAARIPGDKLSVIASRAEEMAGYQAKVGGVQIAEVEVDTRTGVVRVLRVTAIQDFGRPLNRLTAESQVNGAIIQGVSYALLENRVLDRHTGAMANANLEAYKIATASDCPEIDIVGFDVWNGFNNAGVMGLGEPPTVPTSAAIANAVAHALGVRLRELPLTPDRVLAATSAAGAGGGAR